MSEKVLPPTPRRRQLAKEQGRAPRSNDLVSSGLLLATTGLLIASGDRIASGLIQSLVETLGGPATVTLNHNEAFWMIARAMAGVAVMVLPMLIAMMMCSIALNVLQTGWRITPQKLLPDASRLSPSQRIQQIFSVRSFGRFGISVMKLIAVFSVGLAVVRSGLPEIASLPSLSPVGIATKVFELLTECCSYVGLTLLVFAIVDYALEWWQHERDLMMTEQELREEMRDAQRAGPSNRSPRTQAVTATST